MMKPRVLVLTAAGKTGLPIALQLLNDGFPVTAFVRKEDQRSERLRSQGADIVVGSITDISDMRRAMTDAQRAYFCTPLAESGYLKAAAVFAAVAAEQTLESVVTMGQWLANPYHPSVHTRDAWLADQMIALLPGTGVTTINVGFFADNDLQALPFAAQFGLLTLPYGSGLNAPPSNEDIARVAAEILARPDGHAGKSYRPTGPALLSPQDIAATFAKVLGHAVKYIDMPIWMFSKVMRGVGISDYQISQYQQYVLDYQRNAFAVDAPTDVVRRITGREPEDFETITRRYASAMPDARRSLAAQIRLTAMISVAMMLPSPKTARHLDLDDFSEKGHLSLSADLLEWRSNHGGTASGRQPSVNASGAVRNSTDLQLSNGR